MMGNWTVELTVSEHVEMKNGLTDGQIQGG